MRHTLQINTGPEEPVLWGNAYRSEAFIGGIRGQTLAGHAVMSKKLKTQRAWKTIQNKTTRDYEQTRIIHRGAVKNRTNYMCRYVHSHAKYGGSTDTAVQIT